MTLNFLIVAFVVFLMVKQINRLKREPAPAAPNTKDCPFCISPIPLAATRCPNCTSNSRSKFRIVLFRSFRGGICPGEETRK